MKTLKEEVIPTTMRAVVLTKFGKPFEIREIPVPKPQKGQVLLKMASSPINPSDYAFINGAYSSRKVPPIVPGFEGSGLVVASGEGYMSGRLLGKNVAGFAPQDDNGTWAEYMLTGAKTVVPIKGSLDLEQASMLFVNPLTAYAFVKIARRKKRKSILNTAGASALGMMLQSMCNAKGIDLVSIVRRQEQVDLIKEKGGKYVVNTSDENYETELQKICKDLNVRLGFDAISGEMPDILLKAMPNGSELRIYGGLSEKAVNAEPGHFIFNGQKIGGFWLSHWITTKHPLQLLRIFPKVQRFLENEHDIVINKRLSLTEAFDGIEEYMQNMTKGKMIVTPWKD